MSGMLGCAGEYSAAVHARGGAQRLFTLDNVAAVEWERRLSDVSTARVTVAKGSATADCCANLSAIAPWAHELSVYRDGALVWQGPVLRPVERADEFEINALDLTGWWGRWPVDLYGKLGPADAVTLVKTHLDKHFLRPAYADPGMKAWLTYVAGAVPAELDTNKGDSIADVVDGLTRAALDYTTVGRRVVVMPDGYSYGGKPVARLSDEHLGGEFEVSLEGDETVTLGVATGTDDPAGQPYYVESLSSPEATAYGLLYAATAAQTASTAVLKPLASKLLRSPPPAVLRVPDDAAVSPDAPVQVAELVCGARIDVVLGEGWCRQVARTARLVRVHGTWDGDAGEQITVALVRLDAPVTPDA